MNTNLILSSHEEVVFALLVAFGVLGWVALVGFMAFVAKLRKELHLLKKEQTDFISEINEVCSSLTSVVAGGASWGAGYNAGIYHARSKLQAKLQTKGK